MFGWRADENVEGARGKSANELSLPRLAVGGLLVEGDSILLVRRKNPPAQGLWTLPGGRVRAGERLRMALKREFLEETGLVVEPVALADVFEVIQKGEDDSLRFHYVILDYWVRRLSGNAEAGTDAVDLQWFPLDGMPVAEMPPESLDFIRRVLRQRPPEVS